MLLFLSFGFVTAPVLSWAVPTEFGASACTAATLVPVSATSSAMQATTIAGDGRRSINLCM
jgi:hypothetical protein